MNSFIKSLLSRLPKTKQIVSFGQSLPSRLPKLWRKIERYLNGSINIKFMSHPAFRWGLIGLAALYIGVGAVVSYKVYKVKSESTNIRRILAVYPLPAVLMPQDIILVGDYLNQLKHIRHFAEKTKNPLPADPELRSTLLNQMVETRLLLRVAERYGARVSRSDIDAVYQKIAESNGGEQEVGKLLKDLYGMNEKEFRLLIRDQLLREKVRKEVLTQVRISHILFTKDEGKAKEILETLKKSPEKWDELAKQYSEDRTTSEQGGDFGVFFGYGDMAEPVEKVAFDLKKGEIAPEVIKSDQGFQIVKVTDRKGKIDKSYEQFIGELRKKAKVWTVLK